MTSCKYFSFLFSPLSLEADSNQVTSDQLEDVPSENNDTKSSDATETAPPAPEAETCEITEAANVQKKSVRGRKTKVAESQAAADKPEVTEDSEDPVVPVPVRGRRGRKTEAAVPPAGRQTTRRRNAKSQESASDDQPETIPEKDVKTASVDEIESPESAQQEENDSATLKKEAAVKPTRGRKAKTPVEPPQQKPEEKEVVGEEHLVEEVQSQKSIPAAGKSRRGRKKNTDVEQTEVAEETVVTVEAKEQPEPQVGAKRGRNAKQEEEKHEGNDEAHSVEPVKKLKRTRKAEQDHVEPREVQPSDVVVPEEADAPLVAEPVKATEPVDTAAKPRRGGRKAKQDPKSETSVEPTEVQEIPAASSTDKPQQGRRGKKVTEEVKVTPVVEPEEEGSAAAEVPSNKRGRRVKNEVSLAVPAKRPRRGAAPPTVETRAESTDVVPESAAVSAEPPKRGRRAAAKPSADDALVTGDQANSSEDLKSCIVDDGKRSKRSVKWKNDIEVFEIQKLTPAKAVRGRKSKLGDQADPDGVNVPEDASKTEEKDLSEKVVKAQPAKRARRGAKIADVPADSDGSTGKVEDTAEEALPKTRRGRSAKK